MINNILYILMRTDLASMSTGRAMAQASHASNAFIHEHKNKKEVQEWQKETNQGFGTAIILAINKGQMFELVDKALKNKIITGIVIDPDYRMQVTTEVFSLIDKDKYNFHFPLINDVPNFVNFSRSVETCAYIFGEKINIQQLIPLITQLSLYP